MFTLLHKHGPEKSREERPPAALPPGLSIPGPVSGVDVRIPSAQLSITLNPAFALGENGWRARGGVEKRAGKRQGRGSPRGISGAGIVVGPPWNDSHGTATAWRVIRHSAGPGLFRRSCPATPCRGGVGMVQRPGASCQAEAGPGGVAPELSVYVSRFSRCFALCASIFSVMCTNIS